MNYLNISYAVYEALLADGKGVSTFRILNSLIKKAILGKSENISFKYKDLEEELGYGARCIGDGIRYLTKLNVIEKTGTYKYRLNKEIIGVTEITDKF